MWTGSALMKLVFDESGFLMKVVFWQNWFLMKVDFNENFFFDGSGFDELVLHRREHWSDTVACLHPLRSGTLPSKLQKKKTLPKTLSTLSNSATRRRRSSSILENKELSSESISTNTVLVWRSESMLVRSRRRTKKKISVLHWCFRNNCLPPSSSRALRTWSHCSFFAEQWNNSAWILPTCVPHWMCV